MMSRLIDANSILDDFLKRYTGMEKDGKLVFAACEIKQDFADMISNATTVDAVEVVRCKDCKHQCKIWHADKRIKEKGYWIYSCKRNSDQFVSHTVNGYDDEYCCYGERKKGENDE